MSGFLVLIVVVVVIGFYQSWLQKGLRARTLQTTLDRASVKAVFSRTVSTMGWTTVDDDNPMVSQEGERPSY
jgi:hypothetical protein